MHSNSSYDTIAESEKLTLGEGNLVFQPVVLLSNLLHWFSQLALPIQNLQPVEMDT